MQFVFPLRKLVIFNLIIIFESAPHFPQVYEKKQPSVKFEILLKVIKSEIQNYNVKFCVFVLEPHFLMLWIFLTLHSENSSQECESICQYLTDHIKYFLVYYFCYN